MLFWLRLRQHCSRNLCNMSAWAWLPVEFFTGGDEAEAMQASLVQGLQPGSFYDSTKRPTNAVLEAAWMTLNQAVQCRELPTSTLQCFTHVPVPSVSANPAFEVFRLINTCLYAQFVSSVVAGRAHPLILSSTSVASELIRKPRTRYQRTPERTFRKAFDLRCTRTMIAP